MFPHLRAVWTAVHAMTLLSDLPQSCTQIAASSLLSYESLFVDERQWRSMGPSRGWITMRQVQEAFAAHRHHNAHGHVNLGDL